MHQKKSKLVFQPSENKKGAIRSFYILYAQFIACLFVIICNYFKFLKHFFGVYQWHTSLLKLRFEYCPYSPSWINQCNWCAMIYGVFLFCTITNGINKPKLPYKREQCFMLWRSRTPVAARWLAYYRKVFTTLMALLYLGFQSPGFMFWRSP